MLQIKKLSYREGVTCPNSHRQRQSWHVTLGDLRGGGVLPCTVSHQPRHCLKVSFYLHCVGFIRC